MTDQNAIPAEKVRELAEKYDNAPGNPDRLLVNAIADLRALLPAPPQPTGGLLGRWAKHDDYGDVVCMWDKPSRFGKMRVAHVSEGKTSGAEHWYAEFDSLTFPHQATKPEDVPAGEAWRVRHCGYGEFNAVKTSGPFPWLFFNPEFEEHDGFRNNSVTLISPLTPERPGKGDEQPAWRIEHDWRNLRGDEYIIDKNGDPVVTETKHWAGEPWYTDGFAVGESNYAPFIVFPSKDAATPEAIKEAKKARDKEMDK